MWWLGIYTRINFLRRHLAFAHCRSVKGESYQSREVLGMKVPARSIHLRIDSVSERLQQPTVASIIVQLLPLY